MNRPDYDPQFILTFTDSREGIKSMDFDTLAEAERMMKICNRAAYISEVGYDTFTQTRVDHVRITMTKNNT